MPKSSAAARLRARQAERTKGRILKIATAEFAIKGYDGARIDEIVRRCKVSKNLVYYYFGSKERLFIAALEAAYAVMRARQGALSLVGLGPVEGMRKLITETFRHFAEAPEFIGLLNSENLHKARHLRKSSRIRAMYLPLVESIRGLLELGRATGAFRADVDPVDLYISISGMGYHALSNRFTLSVLFDRDLSSPEQLELRLAHMVDVILSYLRYQGGPAETAAAATPADALGAGARPALPSRTHAAAKTKNPRRPEAAGKSSSSAVP